MKYVVILILLGMVAGLIYWRLRPYLKMARRVLGAVREARIMSTGGGQASSPQARRTSAKATNEKLVRCASCGTWLPASRAVALRTSKASYCSHACLERAADTQRSTRRSAS